MRLVAHVIEAVVEEILLLVLHAKGDFLRLVRALHHPLGVGGDKELLFAYVSDHVLEIQVLISQIVHLLLQFVDVFVVLVLDLAEVPGLVLVRIYHSFVVSLL